MGQALALAAAGSIYPVALAAVVALLGGADPLRRSLAFVAGGALASAAGFTVVIACLSAGRITPHHHPIVVAALKIAIGAILLAVAVRTARRRRAGTPAERSAPSGSMRGAFVAGIVVYLPGIFLVASARALADSDLAPAATVVSAFACIVVLLAIAELPVLCFALAPDRVQPALEAVTGFGRRHAGRFVPVIEAVAGTYLILAGARAL